MTIDKIKLPNVSLDNFHRPSRIKPPGPISQMGKLRMLHNGPTGINRIFDLVLDGETLFLVEWKQETSSMR